jgi:glycosyltransferase involved in cell wall biosynthesis
MGKKIKKIKILIFAPFFPPHKGGLETHIKEFVENLVKYEKNLNLTFNVLIFTPFIPKNRETLQFDKNFERKLNKKVNIIRYEAFELAHHFPIPKFWKPSFWKQLNFLIKFNPDIIESHTRFFFSSLIALIYSKLFKKPLIHFEHGSEFIKSNNKIIDLFVLFWDRFFGKLVLNGSTIIIAVSKAVKRFLLKKMKIKNKKIFVSYRGLELKKLEKVKSKEEIKLKFKDKIIIGFVGRLVNWKGVQNSILAIKSLPVELKNKVAFLIIGDGPERKYLEKLAKEDINKTIFFLGQKDFEEAKAIQKNFDIYIHSSYPGGGLSTSLLEAMALGNSIVASPYEGAKEVIINKKTGILLKNNSPEEIKKALIYLLKNEKLRKKLAENAKKFVEKNFNWKDKIQERIRIFKEVLK